MGVGNVAEKAYLGGVLKIPQVRLVAVCDVVEDQAKRMQEMFDVPECYSDIDDMLGTSDIEAVVVLSSIPTHAQSSLAAIRAGAHVHSEKPMATTMEDADGLIEEAARAGVKLVCAPPTILNPQVEVIRELIEGGAIGRVCYVRAHTSHQGPGRRFRRTTDMTWFYKPDRGPLFDLGVYAIHELAYTLGPARRVAALARTSIPQITVRSGPVKGKQIDVEVDNNNLILVEEGVYDNDVWKRTEPRIGDFTTRGLMLPPEGVMIRAKLVRY